MLRAIRALYQASEACVKVDGECSEWFEVKQGVRQGCPMSPWLFNIFLDMVVKEARDSFQRGVCLDTRQVQILLFADDAVLVTENGEHLKQYQSTPRSNKEAQVSHQLGEDRHHGDQQEAHGMQHRDRRA